MLRMMHALAMVLAVAGCFRGANAVGSACPRLADVTHPVRLLNPCDGMLIAGKLEVSSAVNCTLGTWPPDVSIEVDVSINEIRVASGGVLYVTVFGWVQLETDVIEVEDGGELYIDGTGYGGKIVSETNEACLDGETNQPGLGGESATTGRTVSTRAVYRAGTMLDTSEIYAGRGGCETSPQTSKHSIFQGGAALYIDAGSFLALGIVDIRFDGCITEFVNPLVSNYVGGGAGGGVVFSVPVMSGHFSVSVNGADPTLGDNAFGVPFGGSGGLILVDSTSTLNVNYTMDAVGRGGGYLVCVAPRTCIGERLFLTIIMFVLCAHVDLCVAVWVWVRMVANREELTAPPGILAVYPTDGSQASVSATVLTGDVALFTELAPLDGLPTSVTVQTSSAIVLDGMAWDGLALQGTAQASYAHSLLEISGKLELSDDSVFKVTGSSVSVVADDMSLDDRSQVICAATCALTATNRLRIGSEALLTGTGSTFEPLAGPSVGGSGWGFGGNIDPVTLESLRSSLFRLGAQMPGEFGAGSTGGGGRGGSVRVSGLAPQACLVCGWLRAHHLTCVPCLAWCRVCVSQSFTLSADTVTVSGTVNAAGEDGPTDHGGGGGGSIRIEASSCDVTGALLATGGDAHGTCDFSIVGAGVLHHACYPCTAPSRVRLLMMVQRAWVAVAVVAALCYRAHH